MPSAHLGVEFTEQADPEGRSMSSFGLGAMARSGFTHMGSPMLPSFFSVRRRAIGHGVLHGQQKCGYGVVIFLRDLELSIV